MPKRESNIYECKDGRYEGRVDTAKMVRFAISRS